MKPYDMLKIKDALLTSVCYVDAAGLFAEGFFEVLPLLWCYLALQDTVVSPRFVKGLCCLQKVTSLLAIAIDSKKSQTYYQLSINTSNQIYKTHLLANINNTEDYFIHKIEVNNKNDDINSLLRSTIRILGVLEEK
jgi:hypothetical protein